MQEQERVANEEAEKRLKAALTAKSAKREPSSTPHIGSPSVTAPNTPADIPNESKPIMDKNAAEDVSMEIETAIVAASSPSAEVSAILTYEALK